MDQNVIFNIITRTSNRPNYFKQCQSSIMSQTYKGVNRIITFDNEKDFGTYIEHYND